MVMCQRSQNTYLVTTVINDLQEYIKILLQKLHAEVNDGEDMPLIMRGSAVLSKLNASKHLFYDTI